MRSWDAFWQVTFISGHIINFFNLKSALLLSYTKWRKGRFIVTVAFFTLNKLFVDALDVRITADKTFPFTEGGSGNQR